MGNLVPDAPFSCPANECPVFEYLGLVAGSPSTCSNTTLSGTCIDVDVCGVTFVALGTIISAGSITDPLCTSSMISQGCLLPSNCACSYLDELSNPVFLPMLFDSVSDAAADATNADATDAAADAFAAMPHRRRLSGSSARLVRDCGVHRRFLYARGYRQRQILHSGWLRLRLQPRLMLRQ